ncbi:hypothetical protein AQF52_4887 [Streptomyces venezuelae]|uniref:hypothetical protein n=1 Tax=Streptomyces gardneri TaxID=66892 RepID=UPI0006BC66DE|nr:hypothetical protein [Streptomyces gardneri]ALO10481.1 hypothetical protein AQF52_4887 [Streptomyces venezuelae]QPK47478.1 hypothetical protein H4W23_24515 [Streptomyces gardneri]WRK38912.1 hypothetical protein U0M97_24620 [Streptomyces venezuelae]CUM39053.1 hypothetical protein BN2537_7071 [Streptomyces venezuelae]
MERAGGAGRPGPVTVDNGSGIVVVGDGNRVGPWSAPDVTSAYLEQVRRIAPPELLGREEELAELAAFCRTGHGYTWWRADAWAGKSALMAWLVLNPPAGVRIVPFFVTARRAAQNDATAYAEVVIEQLAELAGEGLPALLTPATREAHLMRLHRTAARVCAGRGERLVLLVDGLDEDRGVTTGPDAHSIAALLPYDLPVIVSGRLNPPLPGDVPESHPLRDPGIVRTLAPSRRAHAIQVEAERELKHLLEAGGLPYDLLALLTAAGGGLTADDLAELTREVPFRVRDVLRTGPGRTFAVRDGSYLLAHEELAASARVMLGARELDRWRTVLRAWAARWQQRGWPEGTPEYLLHGYVPMLRAVGDVSGVVDCALDAVRHDRLLGATGGDGVALGEVRAAGEIVLAEGDQPGLVTTMLRLALRRTELRGRNGHVPVELPAAWTELDEFDRALALARGLEPSAAAQALCGVALVLHEKGERARAYMTAAEAGDHAALPQSDPGVGRHLVEAWIALGRLERAERVWRGLPRGWSLQRLGQPLRDVCLPGLVAAWCRAGEPERALALCAEVTDAQVRVLAAAAACGGLAEAGRVADAEEFARSSAGIARSVGLLATAAVLRRDGREERAAFLVAEVAAEPWMFPFGSERGTPLLLMSLLVEAGAVAEAEELAAQYEGLAYWKDPLRGALATALARTGETERSWELALGLDEPARGAGCADVCCAWAEAGVLDRIDLAAGHDWPTAERHRVNEAWIRALVRAGRVAEAESAVPGPAWAPAATVVLARALARAGEEHHGRARELLRATEAASRRPRRDEQRQTLWTIAETLADADSPSLVLALVRGVTYGPRVAGMRVRAAAARGWGDEAWRLAEEELGPARTDLARLALRALVRAGGHAAAVERVRRAKLWDNRFDVMDALVQELLAAGETDRALAARPHTTQACADIALALHAEGRYEEADRLLRQAVDRTYRSLFRNLRPLGPVVRALRGCGNERAAADLLDEGMRCYGGDWHAADHLLAGLLAGGRYGPALERVRAAAVDDRHLLRFAGILARGGAYEQAEVLLGELAPLGAACAPVHVALALAHPDPVRAREHAALALHFGPWYEALPAVLHCAPGALPIALAEADRLRRALEV